MAELEVSDDECSTDDSGINEHRTTINSSLGKGEQPSLLLNGSVEKSKEMEGSSEERRGKETPLSFLQQLDARIKSSKQESEKLR